MRPFEKAQEYQAHIDEKKEKIPLTDADPSTWPDHVRMVSLQETTKLGVDVQGRLYWDGKLVEIRRTIELRKFERGVAGFVAAVAFAGLLLSGWQWACKFQTAGVVWCPAVKTTEIK